jgi:hypothetical protein
LLESTCTPENKVRLLAVLLLITVLTVLRRYIQSRKDPMILIQWWRSTNRTQTFIMALPAAFGASTFAVWLLSRLVFPVFVQRYFVPNIILHTIWLSALVDFVLSHFRSSKTKYGLVLASAVLAGVSIKYRQYGPEERIPLSYPLIFSRAKCN